MQALRALATMLFTAIPNLIWITRFSGIRLTWIEHFARFRNITILIASIVHVLDRHLWNPLKQTELTDLLFTIIVGTFSAEDYFNYQWLRE